MRRAGHLDSFLQNDGRVAGFAVDEENRNRSNPAEALAVVGLGFIESDQIDAMSFPGDIDTAGDQADEVNAVMAISAFS